MRSFDRTVKTMMAVFGVFVCTALAFAGDEDVLRPSETPKGYSLKRMAKLTAVYNTGFQADNPATPPPPDVPFHILVEDATVKRGTMLYLPIFYADDSGGAGPGFPKHMNNQEACADYLDELVFDGYGVEAFIVQVDGQTKILNDDYIVGTKTAPLLDGTPAGTHYIVAAAFIEALKPGTHTVAYGGIIDGEAVVFASMTVTVR